MRQIIALLTLLLLLVACTQSQSTTTSAPTIVPTLNLTATPPGVLTATEPSTPNTASSTPSALTPLFDEILERVAEIRGLDPLKAISPKFMTREQLANTLRENLDESRDDIRNSQDVMKIMGLIPQNADLYELLLSMYGEQVLGFYNPETEELYVIKGMAALTPLEELTLAHEYTHALQQQHFDIHNMGKAVEDDSDADAALSALIEGDAIAVQTEYMLTYLTSEQRENLFGDSGGSPMFDASPYILQESLQFPYRDGQVLVKNLILAKQWKRVNDAYMKPPVSTEQVLHFAKFEEGENPATISLPDLSTALGQDWEMVYEDVLGEFFLETFLETRAAAPLPARAAEGWGGDRFNLMTGPQGEQAMVTLLAWDSKMDAQEFFNTLDSSNSVPEDGFLGINGDHVLWVFSPSRAITDEIVSLFPDF